MEQKIINSIPWCESSLKEMKRNLTLVKLEGKTHLGKRGVKWLKGKVKNKGKK